MEPATLSDLWEWARRDVRWQIALVAVGYPPSQPSPEDAILYNLRLAAILARLYYYRVPQALPKVTSLDTLWGYYKPYWNTPAGATTLSEFKAALMTTDIV